MQDPRSLIFFFDMKSQLQIEDGMKLYAVCTSTFGDCQLFIPLIPPIDILYSLCTPQLNLLLLRSQSQEAEAAMFTPPLSPSTTLSTPHPRPTKTPSTNSPCNDFEVVISLKAANTDIC